MSSERITLAPTGATGERLETIDIVRGFALAGVLLMNLGVFTLFDYLSPDGQAQLVTARLDVWVEPTMRFIFDGKAITLFSLLFGLGFSVQLQRAEARGAPARSLYFRRLGVLAVFGVLHAYLFWWGDVLRFYAIFGFALWFVRRASERTLLAAGLITALLIPGLLVPIVKPLIAGTPQWTDISPANVAAFSADSYPGLLRQNLAMDRWTLVAFWSFPFFVFGRLLLGFWAGRKGLLQNPAAHAPLLRRIFWWSLVIGLIGTTFARVRNALGLDALFPFLASGLPRFAAGMWMRAGVLGLGVAYGTGLTLLCLKPAWRTRLRVLAPVGQMALTNYLTQTAVCLTIFYGIGFGLGPHFGTVSWLAIWALLFGAQIVFSRAWLARFRMGPMEWLWRSLSYGAVQPLRRPAPAASSTPVVVDRSAG